MKLLAKSWVLPFKDAMLAISGDTPVQSIRLEDFLPTEGAWGTLNGRATLIGDAARAMTMYRGEAANHGIMDVQSYFERQAGDSRGRDKRCDALVACSAYEKDVVQRTIRAVLASRVACLDAHGFGKIDETSPLISKRAIVASGY